VHRRSAADRTKPLTRSVAVGAMLVGAVALLAACGGTSTSAPDTSEPATSAPATSGPGNELPDNGPQAAASTAPAAPSSGCGSTAGDAGAGRRVITVDGTERWYLWTPPEQPTRVTPPPLLLDFHGLAEGAEFHSAMSGLEDLARQEGFALATPNGTGDPVAWGIGTGSDNADLRFVEALVEEISASNCIDVNRIFATGLSNGALLSSALACALSDRIAAIATVAGIADPADCRPSRRVPILNFHGTDDAILLFNGGVGDLGAALQGGTPSLPPGYVADLDGTGVPAAVAAWAARNGCVGSPSDDRQAVDVLRRTYRCPADGEVVSYVIEGGGHSWPGSEVSATLEPVIGKTTRSISANEQMWEFFTRHALRAGPVVPTAPDQGEGA